MEREAKIIQAAQPEQDRSPHQAPAGDAADRPAEHCEPASMQDRIIAALRTVYDPEIPVNVYDLGLIYRVAYDGKGLVEIDMTLTAPGCPVAGEITGWVRDAARGVAGVSEVTVALVFDPPWDKSKMSEEAQIELGFV